LLNGAGPAPLHKTNGSTALKTAPKVEVIHDYLAEDCELLYQVTSYAVGAAEFQVEVIKNQGAGAAAMRIEAVRRLFPKCWFNEERHRSRQRGACWTLGAVQSQDQLWTDGDM